MTVALAAAMGVVVVTVFEPIVIPLLRRAAIIDVPGHRSSHTVPTPRGGGIPVAAGLLMVTAILHTEPALTLAASIAAFGAIGLMDDLRSMPAATRLVLQAAAAAVVAALLVSRLGWPAPVLAAAAVGIVIWLAGFVNAFNFMDGVNGISGVHALIGGLAFALIGQWRADPFLVTSGVAVAACALAFLPWNAIRARVFLGDAGSYALGGTLATLCAYAVVHGIPPEAAAAPLALYIADTGWTLLRRVRAGERWLEAHRSHVYQRWCGLGWSHQKVTAVTAASTASLAALGMASLGGSPGLRGAADLAALGVLCGYLRSPSLLGRLGERKGASKLRALIVTHYFPPETGAPQARLSALARTWAADGDAVTVLTGMPNHPAGVIPPRYRGAIRRREREDGYDIVRTWLYATPNEGVARKTLGHLSFMISAVLLGGRCSGPADVVLVSSPTFFSIGAGWLLARLKRARLVVEVRDLWPAIFAELGVLTNRRVLRLLERLELAAYEAADVVVVVSDGFRGNLVARGVPAAKVHVIPNGADVDRFDPAAEPDLAERSRLGARPDDVLVLYAGTHGISQGLSAVADAAAALSDAPVHISLVGAGAAKPQLVARVADAGLGNVSMWPGVPSPDVPALLAAADICLVTLRDVPLFETFIPSKMFEYLAAGRPVVGALAGEAAQILREAGGCVVPPEDGAAIAAAIRALAADPQRRAAMGKQARTYVEQYFDRAMLARQYRKLLDPAGAQA